MSKEAPDFLKDRVNQICAQLGASEAQLLALEDRMEQLQAQLAAADAQSRALRAVKQELVAQLKGLDAVGPDVREFVKQQSLLFAASKKEAQSGQK